MVTAGTSAFTKIIQLRNDDTGTMYEARLENTTHANKGYINSINTKTPIKTVSLRPSPRRNTDNVVNTVFYNLVDWREDQMNKHTQSAE